MEEKEMIDMIFVPQRTLHDCGTACCSMILRHYHRRHQYQTIDYQLRPNKENTTSLQAIVNTLSQYDLVVKARKIVLGQPFANGSIGIYHIKTGASYHYVVITEQHQKWFMMVHDPRYLHVTLRRRSRILKQWTGYYIHISGPISTNKVPIEAGIPFALKIMGLLLSFAYIVLIVMQRLMQA